MKNIFEAVREAVPVPLAAERYGLKANHAGMVCCPFHDDRKPSLKLNEDYFYCFGCGAGGDVVELTRRLFDLRPYEAASKLAVDFGVDVPATAPPDGSLNRRARRTTSRTIGMWRPVRCWSPWTIWHPCWQRGRWNSASGR